MKKFLFQVAIELSLFTTMFLDKVIDGLKSKMRARILSDEELKPRCDEFYLCNSVLNQYDKKNLCRYQLLSIRPIIRSRIDEMMGITSHRGWLIPSPKTEIDPASKVMIAQVLEGIISKGNLHVLHGISALRLTVRSTLSRLGVGQGVVHKIMNHSLECINNVYNRHRRMDKMVETICSYSNFLVAKCKRNQLVRDT